MATAPIFVATPWTKAVGISTANTNRDGTGTIATVVTAGASGSKIDHIDIKALVTTTAGMVRLFLHDGSNYFLWREILVPAITPSGTVRAFEESIDCSIPENELLLPASWSLRASTHNAEAFSVFAHGGDF